MAKTVQVKKHFTFVAGLNTEASPLTFPANTWADGDNVIPDVDGSINLRTAIDYEPSFSLSAAFTDTQEANGAFVAGEWNNVGSDGNLHFAVVQRNTIVSFYVNTGTTVSTQAKSFTIDLADYKAAGNLETIGTAPIAVANAYGNLLIVSRDTVPLLVTYTAGTDLISVTTVLVQIRDFLGLPDGLAVDARPATLLDPHKYNLLNQGWDTTKISAYFTSQAVYPSNAQSWILGKNASKDFDPLLLVKEDFGTSPAPKGRFVLNVYNRDRATPSGIAALATETEAYRPTTTAFFAGRAWYAGVRSSTVGSWVMFSQVAENTGKLGKCYQDADPTSEAFSHLVASDGGVIPIQDAGTPIKLLPYGNGMLVLCDNGIWQIVGGLQTGFAADSYEVRRISTVGCISAKSVVLTDLAVLFWGEVGIYIIQTTQSGGIEVVPLTVGTIQDLYDTIPIPGKTYSSGLYVPAERVVYWLYNDSAGQDGVTRRFKKNRLLCLNLVLKSFYTMSIGSLASLSPYAVDLFITRRSATVQNVLLKFLAVHPVDSTTFKATMAQFDQTNNAPRKWRDWYSNNSVGINYSGFLVPGFDFGSEQGADKFIQALYVMVYFRRTETGLDVNGDPINPSSCSLQGRWDFSDTASGNRWSAAQEAYRHVRSWNPSIPSGTFDDGSPVVVTKNKVRGRGKALQLKFTSAPDKDMQMLGWAITYIGNANV